MKTIKDIVECINKLVEKKEIPPKTAKGFLSSEQVLDFHKFDIAVDLVKMNYDMDETEALSFVSNRWVPFDYEGNVKRLGFYNAEEDRNEIND